MRLIFLGPPGSGKGTQSQNICKDYGIKQISTGDILRKNVKDQTELGKIAAEYMNKGELVPDKIMIDIIASELKKPDYLKGFLLDGFPRTIPQAEALDGMMSKMGLKLNCVLVLEVPHEEIIQRISLRRVDKKTGKIYHLLFNLPLPEDNVELYQREDDKEETIRRRLMVYESQTKPLIKYYSSMGLAFKINGVGDFKEVYERIVKVLDSRLEV